MMIRAKISYAGLTVVILLAISTLYWWMASTTYDAEHALWATYATSAAAEQYVRQHQKWPASWAELESVSASGGTVYSWPRDSDEIQKYVDVDFSLTLPEISDQGIDNFHAIKPKVPAYRAYRQNFARLLETVRAVVKGVVGQRISTTEQAEKKIPNNEGNLRSK
jgi:hypothetical protein